MDELNIYFIDLSLIYNFDNPSVFKYFLTYTLIVSTTRVRDGIFYFTYIFDILLGSSEEEIHSFVKETHGTNSARTSNTILMIPNNTILAMKSVLFELK